MAENSGKFALDASLMFRFVPKNEWRLPVMLARIPAVGDPTHIVQFGTGEPCVRRRRSTGCGLQRRVPAFRVVVGIEVGNHVVTRDDGRGASHTASCCAIPVDQWWP